MSSSSFKREFKQFIQEDFSDILPQIPQGTASFEDAIIASEESSRITKAYVRKFLQQLYQENPTHINSITKALASYPQLQALAPSSSKLFAFANLRHVKKKSSSTKVQRSKPKKKTTKKRSSTTKGKSHSWKPLIDRLLKTLAKDVPQLNLKHKAIQSIRQKEPHQRIYIPTVRKFLNALYEGANAPFTKQIDAAINEFPELEGLLEEGQDDTQYLVQRKREVKEKGLAFPRKKSY